MLVIQRIVFLALFVWTLSVEAQTTAPTAGKARTQPQFDPAAVRVLRQTLNAYQKARSYQDQARLTLSQSSADGQENSRTFDSKLMFVRPNKIHYVWPSVTLTCDGRQCLAYYPDLQQYTLQPAPAVISRGFLKNTLMEDVMTLVFDGLIDEKPFEQVVSTIEELKDLGMVDQNGKSYHRLSYAEGTNRVDVTIDPRTALLRSVAISPRKAKGGKWSLTVDYENAVLDQPVDNAAFKIAPPAGARKVERVSLTRQYDYEKLGQAFPQVSLPLLGTDKKLGVDVLLGSKWTFVVFWATWCVPCREELPELQELYRRYKARGFEIVGISVDPETAKDELKNYVTEMNFTFPNLWDSESKLARSLAIPSIPAVLMLDAKGKITQMHVGISPETIKEYEWTVERELTRATSQSASETKVEPGGK